MNESAKFEDQGLEALISASDIAVNEKSGLAIVVIKPDAFAKKGEIVKRLEDSGLYVVKTVTKRLPDDFVVGSMYKGLSKGIEEATLEHFNNGPSEIVLLEGGPDLLQKVVSVTGGDTDPKKCDEESIRYIFGEHFDRATSDGGIYHRNAAHRAKDPVEQKKDLDSFEQWL